MKFYNINQLLIFIFVYFIDQQKPKTKDYRTIHSHTIL